MTGQPRDRRLLIAAASTAAIPGLLLLDSAVAVSRGWRPNGTIEDVTVAGAVLWLAVLSGAMAWPRGRDALRRNGAELALLWVSCLMAALFVETAAAKTGAELQVKSLFHTRGPLVDRVFKPVPAFIPGTEGDARYTTDVRGVRTPGVPSDKYRRHILCIGGSTTECVYLDDTKTWPSLLMQRLNDAFGKDYVWVGSAGFSGFTTTDHAHFLRTSKILKGFDCVIVQPGINDLKEALSGEEGVLHVGQRAVSAGCRPIWARSHLIQLYHDVRRGPVEGVGIEAVDGSEYAARRARRASASLRDELPDLSWALRAYQERLRDIIRACKERGLRVLFTTQPILCAEALPDSAASLCWFGWLADGTYLSLPALRRAMDQYNAALATVCAESDTPCVDLSSMNGQETFFYDDCHFTNAGAREAARLITDWLLTHPF